MDNKIIKGNLLGCISKISVELLIEGDYINLSKLDWWLLKYESAYQDAISTIEAIPSDYTFPRIGDRYTLEFQLKDLYELLEEVSVCHGNEVYFEEQLELYDEVGNNVTEQSSWLEVHKLTAPEEQEIFLNLFADSRELSGYRSELIMPLGLNFSIKINSIDFQYTLRFLDIIERSKKIIIIGVVKHVEDIEVIGENATKRKEQLSTSPAYRRQAIVVLANNNQYNEYLIRFVHGKIGLLKGVTIGKKVKVYADLRGGVLDKGNDVKEYWNSLIGWGIEQL